MRKRRASAANGQAQDAFQPPTAQRRGIDTPRAVNLRSPVAGPASPVEFSGGLVDCRRRVSRADRTGYWFECVVVEHGGKPQMQLLVAVINQAEKLDEILAGFLELGITGATIIDSEGMGRVLAHDIPIFAGLQTLVTRSRPQNQTIFSVIKEDEKVEGAIALIQEICGDLNDPATGIVFTVPVNRVVGLASELGEES